ncbi:MAG: NADH-quinone oxidoreductase subunit D, partial [bacterium]|nr:NADH-quinone oxidoreductase subunit D [bacterium]
MINHYKPSELLPEVSFETKLEKISEGRVLLNLGPQHPSTHGVLRVVLEVDGEYVISARCDLGYLHRGVEKLSEKRSYHQLIVLSDRLDYLSAMTNNLVFAMAIEKLLGIEIPPRSKCIRIIVSELQRIASHLVFIGTYGIDIGAFTPFLYAFGRERENIIRIFEKLCGARLTYNYVRIGGVMYDIYPEFIKECKEFIKKMRNALKEYDELLTYNPIFMDRTKNIGVIKPEQAINYAITGPMLRASGVKYD